MNKEKPKNSPQYILFFFMFYLFLKAVHHRMFPSDSCIMIPLGSNRPKMASYKHFASYSVVIQFNCYKMMSCEIIMECMYSNNPVTHRALRLIGKSAYMSSSASSFRWVKIKRECHLSNVQQSCEKNREKAGAAGYHFLSLPALCHVLGVF